MNLRSHMIRPNHLLLWLVILLTTSGYFYLYDRFYLSRDLQFVSTLVSSGQAWISWLLLMPTIFACLQRWQSTPNQWIKLLMLVIGCVSLCTASQAWFFHAQANISETLLFCYLPANLKIMTLLIGVGLWFRNKTTEKIEENHRPSTTPKQLLCQTLRNNTVWVALDDIIYLQANGNYLNIHTCDEQYTVRSTLKKAQQDLLDTDFIRIHRSYLINASHVEEVSAQQVYMCDGSKLPVGRKHKSALQKLQSHHFFTP